MRGIENISWPPRLSAQAARYSGSLLSIAARVRFTDSSKNARMSARDVFASRFGGAPDRSNDDSLRMTPPHSPPPTQTSGTLPVEGRVGSVRIVRDRWGIPHIYAANQDDLFFSQGFVQAQDRLFQMDVWRRSVQGRLSEVLGSNFIERDAMTRRVQYRGDLDVEWASYGADARAIATAFVRGVNAWVALAQARPPEQ